jgi:hypothetical protein
MTAGTSDAPTTVRRLEGDEASALAGQAAVFEDLQYVLRCCENLVTALAHPQPDTALVEALWTGALVAYARCFSGRQNVLTKDDLGRLELDGDVSEFHGMVLKLRDHYASRHTNPREQFTVGVAQSNDGRPTGVAVTSTPRPLVDDTTVRLLGRLGYALSGLLDARMQQAQNDVLGAAGRMTPTELAQLPLVHLSAEG